jgi:hypothetical protein
MHYLAENHLSANPIPSWGRRVEVGFQAETAYRENSINGKSYVPSCWISRLREPRRGSVTIPKAFIVEGGGDSEWIKH